MSGSVLRALRQPAFVAAVIVLAVCAATLNTVVGKMALHFKKLPIPLRISLVEGIPEKLGPWIMVSVDHPIEKNVEDVLQTTKYVFRDYVDSGQIAMVDIEHIKSLTEDQRNSLLTSWRKDKPSAVIRMQVTYYTGLVDTVAHIPERCFIADGFEISASENVPATIGTYADGSARSLEYRFLNFEDQAVVGTEMPRVDRNVAYFFNCNGAYTSSSIAVRGLLQDLMEPYGYYAKIELMTAAPKLEGGDHNLIAANDPRASKEAMQRFLASALPEVEKCLPDWKAVHAKARK